MNISAPYEIIGEGQPVLAIVTPSSPLAANARDIAQEMGITTCVVLTGLDEEVGVAHEVLRKGEIQVIAGRGQLVYILRQQVDVPVLAVEYSAQDILEALLPFQNSNILIGHLCFPEQGTESQDIARLLGVRLTRLVVWSLDEVGAALEKAAKLGITRIIGGPGLVHRARDRGFAGDILRSGNPESLRRMFRTAASIIALGTRNRQQVEMIRCISDLNPNALLSIDREYRITYANTHAEQLLGNGRQSIVGYLVNEFLPHVDCSRLLLPDTDVSLTTNISGRRMVMSHVPLSQTGTNEGAVLSFQDVADMQRMESNIRQKLYAEQHIAKVTFEQIVGDSPAITEARRLAWRFARPDASVLITGETGTGKDMFAQAIHNASSRAAAPFVSVNCAALPEMLLESELFGYDEGAFTGARKGGKPGLFEVAHNGTLFLDEIGEMPLTLQTRLLRVLQDKRVMRLGSNRLIPVNVRIISATNRDLNEMRAQGSFRDDLFYRINTMSLRIPPLRERREDIPRLAELFLHTYTPQGMEKRLNEDALNQLLSRPWNGNVRELAHEIERAVLLCDGREITAEFLSGGESGGGCRVSDRAEPSRQAPEATAMPAPAAAEREAIRQALMDNQYHRGRTALALGISRATLWRKIREMGL